ncbi:DUF952 domain-containing protein [Paenibacillus lignilyticus]|uniref:DUF952 domain-containing protein n=1 Tax=Paenibacillus lignilyticus TaxID=1172615 RepID=A0ABS5C8T6_9BACL|nr:DUF952 domain-containing protein [Paenibacillus lignilyticus]MBP3962344.1 DUF952 domain-containing protein [Paenibacillus lignilyticus]
MIYHFIRKHEWIAASEQPKYEPQSIAADGFIHCCTREQINLLANMLFQGVDDLLLLEIDETATEAELIYEDLYEMNQLFPHLYGALNLNAVTEISHVHASADGEVIVKPYRIMEE